MKAVLIFITLVIVVSCKQEDADPSVLTGNSITYSLFSGSQDWGYQGEVTFFERTDGFSFISLKMNGPKGSGKFPVHLHYGGYNVEADVAALLNPVNASTGQSETLLSQFADGKAVKYDELVNINAHIKVHLDDGENKDIILVFGNIGSNPPSANAAAIANCASW